MASLSSCESSSGRISWMPLRPRMHGTPTDTSFSPYSPSRWTESGVTRRSLWRMDAMSTATTEPMPNSVEPLPATMRPPEVWTVSVSVA